jgi:hypothetical protein
MLLRGLPITLDCGTKGRCLFFDSDLLISAYAMQAQDQETTCISLALVDISKWAAFETAHSSMIQSISALLESEDNDAITKLSQARAQSLEMLPGYAPNERTGA